MKKTVIILVMLLAAAATYAQDVKFSVPSIGKEGGTVTVRLRARIGKKAAKRNHSLIFAPEITDGTYRWSLPAIIVQGKGSKVQHERRLLASGDDGRFDNAVFTKNGQSIEYTATAPYQGWMEGAGLSIEGVEAGCCSEQELASGMLASNLKLQPEPEPVIVPEPVLTTGDHLAQVNPYVIPYSQFEELERQGLLFDEERENTIVVRYGVGKYDIVPDFADNRRMLTDLMASITRLENSADSEVATIVVAGFASPEGTYELNDRLAWNRAVSLKEYILAHSDLGADGIKVYNGSADYQGLRMLVEASDMPQRAAVLEIIDNVPVWDAQRKVGRLGELMRLDGGQPYRYMLTNFFPKLRNAAYIKVYYRNK